MYDAWLRQARSLSPRSAAFNRHVLALEVADFVEAPAERRGKGRIGRSGIDEIRPPVSTGRNRPRNRRAAEQCDELATTAHSITSSASASTLSGILTPSAFAVLRLITNSNLVGCTTGRSATFSPFKIRPA